MVIRLTSPLPSEGLTPIYLSIYMYIYIYIYISIYLYIYIPGPRLLSLSHSLVCVRACVCVRAHAGVCVCVCARARGRVCVFVCRVYMIDIDLHICTDGYIDNIDRHMYISKRERESGSLFSAAAAAHLAS